MLAKFFCLIPAVLAYAVPRQTGCSSDTLPTSFTISSFTSTSTDNGTTLGDFTFQYQPYAVDSTTVDSITCSYNSSSVAVIVPGRSDRWACDDSLSQFLYSSNRKLMMVQKACLQNNEPTYEASGSVILSLSCAGTGNLSISKRTGQTCSEDQVKGTFFSLTPIATK